MSDSKYPGKNSRDIAAHQDQNLREAQRLLLQALKRSKSGDKETAEQLTVLAMELIADTGEIERLLKEATRENGNIQKVLELIDRKQFKALNSYTNGNGHNGNHHS
jgi:hypothetical protein